VSFDLPSRPKGHSMSSLSKTPLAWDAADDPTLRKIRGVCLDIDDTLSTSGKLTATAYEALWKLEEAGFAVVPITGRPAGWCDHIARFWPVDAVVGENGAFTFFMNQGIRKRITTPAGAAEATLKKKLEQLGEQIRLRFPRAKWASDQGYREYDLAIDICEDVPTWDPTDVNELLALCHQNGAHAKLSSIHVNAWFGEYDKKKGFEYWISQGAPGLRTELPSPEEWLYIGDSPNDEPMFGSFKYSVGVANLEKYLDRLTHPPVWLTSEESGKGFVQMAEKLISAREIVRD
jgi:HAD superfamily hydrolase (TIGR01484 family)